MTCDRSSSAPARGVASSGTSSSDTASSAPSSATHSPSACSARGSGTGSCPGSQSSTTCAPSTAPPGAVSSMSSPAASPARDSAAPGSGSASTTRATSGPTLSESCERPARRGSSSRTWTAWRRSTIGASFSKTLRRLGTMLDGACSPPETWALPTFDGACGCLPPIPTPSASSYGSNRGGAAGRVGPTRHSLQSMARHGLWPKPSPVPAAPRGELNPAWVEWLMGWPIGWTDPDGGMSSEAFRAWLGIQRTALTAYVASATVRWPSRAPSPGDFSGGRDD